MIEGSGGSMTWHDMAEKNDGNYKCIFPEMGIHF